MKRKSRRTAGRSSIPRLWGGRAVVFTACTATFALLSIVVVALWYRYGSGSLEIAPSPELGSETKAAGPDTASPVGAVRAHRQTLDATVWDQEVEAQKYERVFVQLWDKLRASNHDTTVLKRVPFQHISLGKEVEESNSDWGIKRIRLESGGDPLGHGAWVDLLDNLTSRGFELIQSEWHHAAFYPQTESTGPQSDITFKLHGLLRSQQARLAINGTLRVRWNPHAGSEEPRIDSLSIFDAEIWTRVGPPLFQALPIADADDSKLATRGLSGIMVYDLKKDRRPEIILSGRNAVYWNGGNWRFRVSALVDQPVAPFYNSVLADFDGDGNTDLVGAPLNSVPLFYRGDASGKFLQRPQPIDAAGELQIPSALTAGDIDGDGDLDLWIAQYKSAYRQGQFPQPYYDSNDGFPSVLLINDGSGTFVDETTSRGLGAKRFRRTFSASFADLDNDRDLDLLTVNDYAGIDVYENDGRGTFHDVTAAWINETHNFGMSHTFADFDGDGAVDFFVTGMASTTARRLERLGLGRAEFPEHQHMRMKMAYGNRMYLNRPGKFVEPSFRDQVNRSGWSWGATSFDFDNDGDCDIFVANGYLSGQTAKDYCTQFWCHDIYVDDKQPVVAVQEFHALQMTNLFPQMSWNGYEHNCLFMNHSGSGFQETGWLMGLASEYDSRSTVAADLNMDGSMDLLVMEMNAITDQAVLHVYWNQLSRHQHWIGVQLQEEGGGISPLGATVHVKHAGGTHVAQFVTGESYFSQHPNIKHFGLGRHDRVDAIKVTWPSGLTKRLKNPAVDQYYLVRARDAETVSSSAGN